MYLGMADGERGLQNSLLALTLHQNFDLLQSNPVHSCLNSNEYQLFFLVALQNIQVRAVQLIIP